MIKDLQKLWLTNLLVNGKKDDNHIGPALNEAGEIIGVTVAASKRRGRVFTTAPVTMDDMLAMANVRPEGKPSGGVTRQGPGDLGYVNYGEKLRDKLVVAKVLCLVDGPSRGRRATRGF